MKRAFRIAILMLGLVGTFVAVTVPQVAALDGGIGTTHPKLDGGIGTTHPK